MTLKMRAVLAVSLCSLLLLPAAAQMVTGTIVGTITDPSGAVLPGVRVELRNVDTNQVRSLVTNSAGSYVAANLPIGNYEVAVEAPGFSRQMRTKIRLDVDQRVRVDVQMTLGERAEIIEVQGGAPLVRTETSEGGQVIGETQVEELPLNGRNFVQLVTLTTGVGAGLPGQSLHGNSPSAFRSDTAVSVNAGRADQNNFLLDGVDNNEADVNTIVIIPIVDGIQEFKVLTTNFSAEYGRAAGAVVSVQTKSGTNELHGVLFEFHRNAALDAKNYFDNPNAEIPKFVQNQFGGAIGGPILRDKTFFFADYQGTRIRKGETFVGTVPTAAMKNGDFRELPPGVLPGNVLRNPFGGIYFTKVIPPSDWDPVAAQLIQLYPEPNRPGLFNNFINNPVTSRRDDQFDVRVDHVFSQRSNFFARYSFGDVHKITPSHLTGTAAEDLGGDIFTGIVGRLSAAGDATVRTQGIAANHTFLFTPTLINEFRFGWTRFALHNEPEGFGQNLADQFGIPGINLSPLTSGFPRLQIAGAIGFGPGAFLPDFSTQNTYQFIDNVSWIKGRHSFKFGIDYRNRSRDNYETFNQQGVYLFTPRFTGIGLADFLTGWPTFALRTLLHGEYGKRSWELAGYVQDDIAVTPRFKLNLGLRYEVWQPVYEAEDRWSNFDPVTGNMFTPENSPHGRGLRKMDKNNFAPRLGFAFDLFGNSRTVLNGAYGVTFLEDGGQVVTLNLADNFPFAVTQTCTTCSAFPSPANRLSSGFTVPPVPFPSLTPFGNAKGIDPEYRTPYTQMWHFTIQQELARDYVFEVGYTGSLSLKQRGSRGLNQAVPSQVAACLDAACTTPNPAFVPEQVRRPYFAINPALAGVTQSQSVGTSNYHALQVKMNKRFANGLGFLTSYTWSKAISTDEGALSLCADAGVLDSRRPHLDRSVSCTDISHRFVFSHSYELPFGRGLQGPPRAILHGWQLNGITVLRSGTPFTPVFTAVHPVTGAAPRPNVICDPALSDDERSATRWFDTSCLVRPDGLAVGNEAFGTAGRNILRGPGQVNFDFSIFKNFVITEGTRLQFRTEFFNLFNTPQFQVPERRLDVGGAAAITETVNTSRQIQLALKFTF